MRVSSKHALQNSNFLTTHAGLIKFSGEANMKKSFPQVGPSKIQTF